MYVYKLRDQRESADSVLDKNDFHRSKDFDSWHIQLMYIDSTFANCCISAHDCFPPLQILLEFIMYTAEELL